MTTADDYINKVLETMPAGMPSRVQIAAELRSHIAERLAHGHPLDEVLRKLGDPTMLADSYLAAEPLVSAPFGARVAAKLIDVLCVLAAIVPLAGVLTWLAPPNLRPVVFLCVVFAGGAVVFGAYTMVFERRTGTTIGKRLQGLRVVAENGARISAGQAVVRSVPMFLQMYWIDVMFALFTERSQRAFELLSKTRVVKAGEKRG